MERQLNRRQGAFYSFGNLAGGIYNGFNNAILSLYLASLTGNPFIQGYLSNTRTMEGTVIQPLVGRWSDRTTSPLGRRRPFILFCTPISVFFLVIIPFLHGAAHNLRLPLIAAAIILFSITWNMASDPYGALMVDITPEHQRSRYNAILSIVSLVGQILIVVFTIVVGIKKNNIPSSVFWIAGAVLLVAYAAVFFGVKEPARAEQAARREERVPLRKYIADLRRFGEAQKLLLSFFFLWTGLNPLVTFLTIFVTKTFHTSKAHALIVYIVIILFVAICAYPWGKLAGGFGYRRCIGAGTALMIVAALLGLIVPSYIWLFPVAALAGAGFSATTVLNFPYLSTLVPESKIGVFTGLQTAFTSVGVVVSTAVAGLFIDWFGYRSIFAVQAIMMVIDIAILWRVNDDRAREQVAAVERDEQAVAMGPVEKSVPVLVPEA